MYLKCPYSDYTDVSSLEYIIGNTKPLLQARNFFSQEYWKGEVLFTF